jgi:hypothetical protein
LTAMSGGGGLSAAATAPARNNPINAPRPRFFERAAYSSPSTDYCVTNGAPACGRCQFMLWYGRDAAMPIFGKPSSAASRRLEMYGFEHRLRVPVTVRKRTMEISGFVLRSKQQACLAGTLARFVIRRAQHRSRLLPVLAGTSLAASWQQSVMAAPGFD